MIWPGSMTRKCVCVCCVCWRRAQPEYDSSSCHFHCTNRPSCLLKKNKQANTLKAGSCSCPSSVGPRAALGLVVPRRKWWGLQPGRRPLNQREASDGAACEGRGARQQDGKLRFKTNRDLTPNAWASKSWRAAGQLKAISSLAPL